MGPRFVLQDSFLTVIKVGFQRLLLTSLMHYIDFYIGGGYSFATNSNLPCGPPSNTDNDYLQTSFHVL